MNYDSSNVKHDLHEFTEDACEKIHGVLTSFKKRRELGIHGKTINVIRKNQGFEEQLLGSYPLQSHNT